MPYNASVLRSIHALPLKPFADTGRVRYRETTLLDGQESDGPITSDSNGTANAPRLRF